MYFSREIKWLWGVDKGRGCTDSGGKGTVILEFQAIATACYLLYYYFIPTLDLGGGVCMIEKTISY